MALQRKLGFWDVYCLAAGAMISSGLFVLPGLAFASARPAVILSYALAGFLMIPAMLSQAELTTAMPRSGGSYFFIERSMGILPGLLAGLANWFSIALKSAFALIGIGAFAQLFWPGMTQNQIKLVAIVGCVGFTVLNLLSVKGTGRLQVALVAGLLAILLGFVVLGLQRVEPGHYDNFMPAAGLRPVFATAGLVFISYGGLTKVANVAEEIRDPGRNVPRGMFMASVSVSLLYVAAVLVTVGVVDGDELAGTFIPLSLAAGEILGRPGFVALSIAAAMAFITTANGGILAASRTPLAMSRDGMLPGGFQRISRRFGTPVVGILITSGFMIAALALLEIEQLVKMASTMMLLLLGMVNAAVLIMRASGVQNYRPQFRSPWYPWLQIAGMFCYGLLIIEMGRGPLTMTAVFFLLGALWYFLYVRRRVDRESALVYMVKSIVSKEIARSRLEDELRQLAFERDEVVHDRFDHLLHDCAILDIGGAIPAEEVFRKAADLLADRLDVNADLIYQRLRERETQSSTVIMPTVAIPHIIVPGEEMFDLVVVRSKGGIQFPGKDQPVKAAFILAGSEDERNYHLQALMAIAHIVQEHEFLRRWLDAGADQDLRDITLLSKRKRGAPPGAGQDK